MRNSLTALSLALALGSGLLVSGALATVRPLQS